MLCVEYSFPTHLKIEGTGDISFYEDTGTTPKFFWDASAESLGIGTSSPTTYSGYSGLTLRGTNGGFLYLRDEAGTNKTELASTVSVSYLKTIEAIPLTLGTDNTERMRIDSSGNVGIGTTSPSSILDLGSNTNTSQEITISGGQSFKSFNSIR